MQTVKMLRHIQVQIMKPPWKMFNIFYYIKQIIVTEAILFHFTKTLTVDTYCNEISHQIIIS